MAKAAIKPIPAQPRVPGEVLNGSTMADQGTSGQNVVPHFLLSPAICNCLPATYILETFFAELRLSMAHIVKAKQAKAKQRCVMGVGMCLYAQLVQTNNTWCKSAIIMRYHPCLSGFCSRPRLTQPYNHISWCCQNLSSLLLKVSVVAADITISGKLFQTLTILGAKENFLKS